MAPRTVETMPTRPALAKTPAAPLLEEAPVAEAVLVLLAEPVEEAALLEPEPAEALVTDTAEVCEPAAEEVAEEPELLLPASIWAWTVELKVPVMPVKLKHALDKDGQIDATKRRYLRELGRERLRVELGVRRVLEVERLEADEAIFTHEIEYYQIPESLLTRRCC